MFLLDKSAIDKTYCKHGTVIRIMSLRTMPKPKVVYFLPPPVNFNVLFQEVFSDFCDGSGFLPKTRVGDAVRCLGENPLQSEVAVHHDT